MNDRYRLLYDGACPLCRREVLALCRRRPEAMLAVDITAAAFDSAAYGLTPAQVRAVLYGIKPDGTVTVGMASLREAYRLAGRGWLLAWTGRWPAKPLCDGFYRWFARHRMGISRLLGRRSDDCGEGCRV